MKVNLAINDKSVEALERAISKYNSAIKRLSARYTHDHEREAYGAMRYLRGLCDMLFTTSNIFVTFEYTKNTFYSEIIAYNMTLAVKKEGNHHES
jgi:hypothetical protein